LNFVVNCFQNLLKMEIENDRDDELSPKEKGLVRMKSIMDYGMGTLWTGMGIFMLFIRHFNTGLERNYDDPTMKLFGGICLLYGGFRIYRGYKKNYFIRE